MWEKSERAYSPIFPSKSSTTILKLYYIMLHYITLHSIEDLEFISNKWVGVTVGKEGIEFRDGSTRGEVVPSFSLRCRSSSRQLFLNPEIRYESLLPFSPNLNFLWFSVLSGISHLPPPPTTAAVPSVSGCPRGVGCSTAAPVLLQLGCRWSQAWPGAAVAVGRFLLHVQAPEYSSLAKE